MDDAKSCRRTSGANASQISLGESSTGPACSSSTPRASSSTAKSPPTANGSNQPPPRPASRHPDPSAAQNLFWRTRWGYTAPQAHALITKQHALIVARSGAEAEAARLRWQRDRGLWERQGFGRAEWEHLMRVGEVVGSASVFDVRGAVWGNHGDDEGAGMGERDGGSGPEVDGKNAEDGYGSGSGSDDGYDADSERARKTSDMYDAVDFDWDDEPTAMGKRRASGQDPPGYVEDDRQRHGKATHG